MCRINSGKGIYVQVRQACHFYLIIRPFKRCFPDVPPWPNCLCQVPWVLGHNILLNYKVPGPKCPQFVPIYPFGMKLYQE